MQGVLIGAYWHQRIRFIKMKFEELDLHPNLLRAIRDCGFEEATPIQAQAIPVIKSGRDLLGSAQTGTGKTGAFVLPILDRLLSGPAPRGVGPRALVLTPTRELATQVTADVATFGRHAKIRTGSIVGGVSYGPQVNLLRRSCDLMVATPGRLLDHMEQGRVDFSRLEVLVLDEADRMLDMGFLDAVNEIARATPANRQTLLFSATLEGKILAVGKRLLRDPETIALAMNTERHAGILQEIFRADDLGHKHRLLDHHLGCKTVNQAVIFMGTKRATERMAKSLGDAGHRVAALHGDMRQGARRRTVEQMREGRFQVLVATDVAARGLDIKGISHVINFDLPMVAEDYIHRIGRTGRAGATGKAISFVGPAEGAKLAEIERITGQEFQHALVPGLEPKTKPRGNGKSTGTRGPKQWKGQRNRRRWDDRSQERRPRKAGAKGFAQR